MHEKLELKRINDEKINKLKAIYDNLCEIHKKSIVINDLCRFYMTNNESIYNITSVTKPLQNELEHVIYEYYYALHDGEPKTDLIEFAKKIDFSGYELVDD